MVLKNLIWKDVINAYQNKVSLSLVKMVVGFNNPYFVFERLNHSRFIGLLSLLSDSTTTDSVGFGFICSQTEGNPNDAINANECDLSDCRNFSLSEFALIIAKE